MVYDGESRQRTFTIVMSKRTESELLPMLSKTSRSTSPVGIGLGLRGGIVGVPAKSRGIGGRILPLIDDAVPDGELDNTGEAARLV